MIAVTTTINGMLRVSILTSEVARVTARIGGTSLILARIGSVKVNDRCDMNRGMVVQEPKQQETDSAR